MSTSLLATFHVIFNIMTSKLWQGSVAHTGQTNHCYIFLVITVIIGTVVDYMTDAMQITQHTSFTAPWAVDSSSSSSSFVTFMQRSRYNIIYIKKQNQMFCTYIVCLHLATAVQDASAAQRAEWHKLGLQLIAQV